MAKIEQICVGNWRPGMPKEGWLVRYGISDYGWKYMKCFSDYIEAVNFYNEKDKEN
jgi:hypothetical protein